MTGFDAGACDAVLMWLTAVDRIEIQADCRLSEIRYDRGRSYVDVLDT
jgi:hypothetical protein